MYKIFLGIDTNISIRSECSNLHVYEGSPESSNAVNIRLTRFTQAWHVPRKSILYYSWSNIHINQILHGKKSFLNQLLLFSRKTRKHPYNKILFKKQTTITIFRECIVNLFFLPYWDMYVLFFSFNLKWLELKFLKKWCN